MQESKENLYIFVGGAVMGYLGGTATPHPILTTPMVNLHCKVS